MSGAHSEFGARRRPVSTLPQATEIPWSIFLTPAFMQRHTRFESLDALSAECGLPATTQEDLRVNHDALDEFIREETPFTGLTHLLRTALREWSDEHLRL